MKLFLLTLVLGRFAFGAPTFPPFLDGVYVEKIEQQMEFKVDGYGYLTTNIVTYYGKYRFRHEYPHRLEGNAAKDSFSTKGYLLAQWTLNGKSWTCRYPSIFLAKPTSDGTHADVTFSAPASIDIPTTHGQCSAEPLADDVYRFYWK